MYKDYKLGKILFSDRTKDRSMPLVNNLTMKSEIVKKSVDYRSAQLWNTLPKEWILNELGKVKFKDSVKEWIIKKRENDYIYF